ncbi:MAG: type II methionyl aminopeptidase [archaeon]
MEYTVDEEAERCCLKAGKISAKIAELIRKIVKPNMAALEIAEKVESEIENLGAMPAFPVTVSCDETAAHFSPLWQDKTVATGLVKIDFGISVNGYASDNAISFDLTENQRYEVMIKASETALDNAIKFIKNSFSNSREVLLKDIGRQIQDAITLAGFSPVRNLSGHEIRQYEMHAGITIPNYDNGNNAKLSDGIYAIEPFATSGIGIVQDGNPSGIYQLEKAKPARDASTREILKFIQQEYKTMPFSVRWIVKKFGLRAVLSLKALEQTGCLHQFNQLVEKSRMPVSQSEKTILIKNNKVLVLGEN